jgi:type I restriction enzyme, S subunit
MAAMGSGGTPSSTVPSYYGGAIPWVSIADMTASGKYVRHTAKTLTDAGLAASAAKLYEPDVVLYAMYASLGECALAVGRVSSSQAILGIKPGRELDRDFLYYFLDSIKPRVRSMGQHGTQSNLNAGMVRDFHLPLPPITEQRRIAKALSDADEFIATLERLIAKKKAIKQGMMQELLTGSTRLPGFTESWRHVLLGNHVSYIKTVALSRAQLDETSPLRYLHYGDIHVCTDVQLDAASESMPRAASALASRAGRLQPGDLVFADASEDLAGVGKSVEITAVPREGLVAGLHTIAARFDAAVLADGFKAYLQFIPSFREALLRLAAGTKVLATTRSYISNIILSLPAVEEQKAIATVLTDTEREIASIRRRIGKFRDVKQGMMQELLTGRARLPATEVTT